HWQLAGCEANLPRYGAPSTKKLAVFLPRQHLASGFDFTAYSGRPDLSRDRIRRFLIHLPQCCVLLSDTPKSIGEKRTGVPSYAARPIPSGAGTWRAAGDHRCRAFSSSALEPPQSACTQADLARRHHPRETPATCP